MFTFGEETGMTEFHSGFVCLVGRPNTGKSTLTNALVGAKVAITSTRPQTTRHAIRGIVHSDDFQIILVDTPGLHRPRTLLGKRLNDLVRETYAAVDVIGLCIPADEAIGPGDRWIVEQLRSTGPANTTLVVIVTKIDKVPKEKVVAQLVAVSELVTNAAEIVPVSAMTGDRVDLLIDVLAAALPAGPAYYPDGELTDEPEEVLMAELIREAALQGVRDELPHSLAVVIDEVSPREGRDDLIDDTPRCTSSEIVRRASSSARVVPGCGRWVPRPVARSKTCWAPRSISTCGSRSPRTGSATPNSLADWGFSSSTTPAAAWSPSH